MGENTQEKNLIERKESFFGKVKNFFKNLFSKKNKKEEVVVEETTEVKEESKNEFKEYIKMTEDEETRLLELQRKYRRGEIAESDLTDEQIEALGNLYDKQIAELKKAIEIKQQKISEYKRKKQPKVEENNA